MWTLKPAVTTIESPGQLKLEFYIFRNTLEQYQAFSKGKKDLTLLDSTGRKVVFENYKNGLFVKTGALSVFMNKAVLKAELVKCVEKYIEVAKLWASTPPMQIWVRRLQTEYPQEFEAKEADHEELHKSYVDFCDQHRGLLPEQFAPSASLREFSADYQTCFADWASQETTI